MRGQSLIEEGGVINRGFSSLVLWQHGPTRSWYENFVFACARKSFSFRSFIPDVYMKCTWSTCWTRLGCTCNDSCPRKTARKSWGPTWKRSQSFYPMHGTSCVVKYVNFESILEVILTSDQNITIRELSTWLYFDLKRMEEETEPLISSRLHKLTYTHTGPH